jgi:predicted small metal-binding protein
MIGQIICDCGWSARGTEEDLVAAAQQHGSEAHDMVPTPEQVLAVATPVTGDAPAGDGQDTVSGG